MPCYRNIQLSNLRTVNLTAVLFLLQLPQLFDGFFRNLFMIEVCRVVADPFHVEECLAVVFCFQVAERKIKLRILPVLIFSCGLAAKPVDGSREVFGVQVRKTNQQTVPD